MNICNNQHKTRVDKRAKFAVELVFYDDEKNIIEPSLLNFKSFYIDLRENRYEVSKNGNDFTNCFLKDGKIYARFENHGLRSGKLKWQVILEKQIIPDSGQGFKENMMSVPVTKFSDIELIDNDITDTCCQDYEIVEDCCLIATESFVYPCFENIIPPITSAEINENGELIITTPDGVFNAGVAKGEKGEQGIQGEAGKDGLTTSITVNGGNYKADENGNIPLPDYPDVSNFVKNGLNSTLNIQTNNSPQNQTINNANSFSYFERVINKSSGVTTQVRVAEGYQNGSENRWAFYSENTLYNTQFTMSYDGKFRVSNGGFTSGARYFLTDYDAQQLLADYPTKEYVADKLIPYARKYEVVMLDPSPDGTQTIQSNVGVENGYGLLGTRLDGAQVNLAKVSDFGEYNLLTVPVGYNFAGITMLFTKTGEDISVWENDGALTWMDSNGISGGVYVEAGSGNIYLSVNGNINNVYLDGHWYGTGFVFLDTIDYIVTENTLQNTTNPGGWQFSYALVNTYEQIDFGSGTEPFCGKHSEVSSNGVKVGRNPAWDVKQADGSTVKEYGAYLSDIHNKVEHDGDLSTTGATIRFTINTLNVLIERINTTEISVRLTSIDSTAINITHRYSGNNTSETLREQFTVNATGTEVARITVGSYVMAEFILRFNGIRYNLTAGSDDDALSNAWVEVEQVTKAN